jgi:hypothetical protein
MSAPDPSRWTLKERLGELAHLPIALAGLLWTLVKSVLKHEKEPLGEGLQEDGSK